METEVWDDRLRAWGKALCSRARVRLLTEPVLPADLVAQPSARRSR